MNHLEITARDVFGRRLYYPMNAAAKALARIAGTETLTSEVLLIARDDLGMKLVHKYEDDDLMSTSAPLARTVC